MYLLALAFPKVNIASTIHLKKKRLKRTCNYKININLNFFCFPKSGIHYNIKAIRTFADREKAFVSLPAALNE